MQSAKLNALKSLASLATFRNLALMVALLAVATALILISTTTQAQASNGAVPNLQLSSASPGELTITWDAPDPTPSDYRVIWAKQDLGFLSYKNSNEANRGNEYPSGSERSITLTGLAKGQTFKVQARARYTSGGQNNGPWSGPWTDTITTRVKDDTPAAPTGLTASEVTHDSVSLSWTAPNRGTVTGYRVLRGANANSLSTMTDDTGSTSPEYTDSTVDAETTYHYAVLALSQDGDGAQSATISATTPAAPQQQESKDPPKGTQVPNRVTRGVPTVTSIVRQIPTSSPTNADTLTWRVTFSEEVQRVDAADFSVTGTTATLAVSAVTGVTGAYDVTATGVTLASLDATVTLSIVTGHNIQSTTNNALTNTTPSGTNDNTYVLDNTPPTLSRAEVSGDRLTINLSEAHESPSGDMESLSFFQALLRQFSVTADGQALQLTLFISSQPHIVLIGVSHPFVRQGQTVVLSYADPTTGDDAVALQDAAGNETPSFTTGSDGVPAVTNNSTIAAVVPGAPTSLSATVGSTTSIDLSWTAPADNGGRVISGYKIEVSADSGTTWTVLVATTGSTDTTYEHSGLTIGDTRHYRVSAINTVGTGAVSNTDSATAATVPGAPTNLTATAISDSAINLSWTAPANNGGSAITGYKIERSSEFSAWTTPVANTGSTATTYSSTGLSRRSNYFHRVSAINTVGTGAVSNTAGATTFFSGSSAPTSSNRTVTTTEDTDYTFTTADFPVSDADGDLLSYVIITTLPEAGKGSIYLDLFQLRQVPANISEGSITNGHLRYVPPANANGTGFATFKFKVEDTGIATSASEYTMTINVTPVNDAATGRPSITGNSKVGNTLTASTSGIIDVDGLPDSFTYQWKRFAANGTTFEADIGTNSRTYTLTSSEEGKKVKVEVSFTDNGGTDEGPLVSSAFPSPTPSPATGVPAITVPNALRVKAVLTANKGTIADTNGLPEESTFTWQWVRVDGSTDTDIADATSQTYTLTYADVGKTIKVKASFTDNAGDSEGPLTSAATSTILAQGTCYAPTYRGGATQIWTGKVGVEPSPAGDLGYSGPLSEAQHGSLDTPSFTVTTGGSSFTVVTIRTDTVGRFIFGVNPKYGAVERQLSLYVCDQQILFSEATKLTHPTYDLRRWGPRYGDFNWSDQAERTLYISRDQTPPTFAEVNFSETAITVTFTEDLNAASLADGAFTVKKTPTSGPEETVTLSGTPTINGKTVTLTLGAAPAPTDRVTLTYTKPASGTGNKLADKFGNEAANFTDVLLRSRHEPSGQDFRHSAGTPGFVTVGTVSSGRMSYPADGDPWADYGDSGWGDMFRLVGLEPRKTYRVEVDFNRVANTVGGSIQMYICCNHGPDPYAVSEWDSNYDGRAIFDFDTGRTVGATFVSVIPSNSMNPDGWEFGSYTVTLTDVTGLTRLVSNTSQRPTAVSFTTVGLDTVVDATNPFQLATSFKTGSNPNGYTLDRVTAYIDRILGDATGAGVPKVAIHRDGTGDVPGTKLCDLQMLADYETGLSLSNGDWPDRLYAPDCADNTLAASKTYWVVLSEGSSPAQTFYWVGQANSTDEDPRSASGWSIGNILHLKIGTESWDTFTATTPPLAIGVYGTPK